ncbi:hypothetical protein [Eisenibacter elegans]|uniref:hypothetical protein n=1 Tax=Eisenibacter elegans TaxID=997 RepID=UPI0012B66D6B|nr:hypothetical protein [Eisenibacter elegans]
MSTSKQLTIPPKSRPEWAKMITGEIDHVFQNYVLQLRVYQARRSVENKLMTIHQAVDDIYELCEQYALTVQADFKEVFGEW